MVAIEYKYVDRRDVSKSTGISLSESFFHHT